MPRLAAVDPGIRGSGVAIFHGDTLALASYRVNPVKSGLGPVAAGVMAREIYRWIGPNNDALILEWPRVYPVSKGDPNDLLPLAGIDSALAALVPDSTGVTHYLPRDWKGTVAKEIFTQRILSKLSDPERALIPDVGSLTHNIIDAVGLGLFHLGRLSPKKVIAR